MSEAATLEELLEWKGVRLERLPITEVRHVRLRRLNQRLGAVRCQGRCELGRSVFKDPGLGQKKCGDCGGGTRSDKT